MNEIPIRIIAIATQTAAAVRHTGRAPHYGHPAFTEMATGYGPCRHCLKTFFQNKEERTLFTYNPFQMAGDVPLPGPIYIHAEECERYGESAGYPAELRQYGAVISAFGDNQKLLAEKHVENGEQPAAVQQLLVDAEVRYIHVRDKSAGCYDFRIERAGEDDKD